MKIKYILPLLLLSCEAEQPQPEECLDCDKVISHTKFNLPTHSWGEYVTINECTGVQTEGDWNTQWGHEEPINGNCY